MIKVWEIDFTNFNSGSPPLPNNNVGSSSGTYAVGGGSGMRNVSPGFQFLNRPCRQTERGVTYMGYAFDYYDLSTPPLGCSGNFSGSYTQRSWVCWFNFNGSTENNGGHHGLYHERDGNTTILNGFGIRGGLTGTGQIIFRANSTTLYTGGSDIVKNKWHLVAMTVDKSVPYTKCYYDGTLVYSGSTVPSNTYSTATPPMETVIGVTNSSREVDCMFSYAASYDNVLSDASISGIYDSFLVDSITGQDPIYTISGRVMSTSGTPISGAPVILFNPSDLNILERTLSSGNGMYQINVPYAGNYVIVTTSTPPNLGARGISFSASGTAGSGSIHFYD